MQKVDRSAYKKLEEYGIIGNLDSCALIANDGSVDWACFPHMESPSVFAKLLDASKGGNFSIQPAQEFSSKQSYLENTNILKTEFQTGSGSATVTDFMPVKDWINIDGLSHRGIYRKLECEKGSMELSVNFRPKFDYARAAPSFKRTAGGFIAKANELRSFFQTPVKLNITGDSVSGKFTAKEGETYWFVHQYEHTASIKANDCEQLLRSTAHFWTDWRHKCDESKCVFGGPWHTQVVRSSLLLKLLANVETGAIYAAPTTSIPEVIGGTRNWDYRFNWIRDASFTLQALYNLGHTFEAVNHMEWFLKIASRIGDPSGLKIMYGISEDADLKERILEQLSGYENSFPVRSGNHAAGQRQLDVFGEVVNVMYEISRYGETASIELWEFVETIVNYVCDAWKMEDNGIWEIRDQPRHFVNSKLACWVALDRGIKIANILGDTAYIAKWQSAREEIKNAILHRGFNTKINSFVQTFDSEDLDATSLLIPIVGLLPFDDHRVTGTIEAVMKFLMTDDGLVYRYRNDDGLPGDEGAFLLCSFWLVNNLVLSGRIKEAEDLFNKLLKFASPLGLLSEEIDPVTGRMLGNFPQAFSHIGLINSALYIGKAKGQIQMGPEPIGEEPSSGRAA